MHRSRRRRRFRPLKLRNPRVSLLFVVLVVLFGIFLQKINACLLPAIETMAGSSAVNRMTRSISEAITACVREEGWSYGDFVKTEVNESGQITALTSDLASAAMLKTRAAVYLTEELNALREESFGVPLGTLTGWVIFSGKGPTIRVELLSVGDVELEVRHSFDDAGINQTRHRIFLDVSARIHLMIPGEVLTETAVTSVCVAETVIIGEVPETYLQFGNGD